MRNTVVSHVNPLLPLRHIPRRQSTLIHNTLASRTKNTSVPRIKASLPHIIVLKSSIQRRQHISIIIIKNSQKLTKWTSTTTKSSNASTSNLRNKLTHHLVNPIHIEQTRKLCVVRNIIQLKKNSSRTRIASSDSKRLSRSTLEVMNPHTASHSATTAALESASDTSTALTLGIPSTIPTSH